MVVVNIMINSENHSTKICFLNLFCSPVPSAKLSHLHKSINHQKQVSSCYHLCFPLVSSIPFPFPTPDVPSSLRASRSKALQSLFIMPLSVCLKQALLE